MSQRAWWLDDRRTAGDERPPRKQERRSGRDRRKDNRLRLSLEVAVPIFVRGPDGLQRGLARNISEGGMLIELEELPPLGAELQVTITGIQGSTDAPDALTLVGEVRHHVAWQYAVRGHMRTMKGVGIRFVERAEANEDLPTIIAGAGRTIH